LDEMETDAGVGTISPVKSGSRLNVASGKTARISTSPPRARTYFGQRDQTEGRGETSSMAVSACKSIENPHILLDHFFYCSYN
jgi:hypothetical protein